MRTQSWLLPSWSRWDKLSLPPGSLPFLGAQFSQWLGGRSCFHTCRTAPFSPKVGPVGHQIGSILRRGIGSFSLLCSWLYVRVTASRLGVLEIFVEQMNVRQTNTASCRPEKCAEGPRLNDSCVSARREARLCYSNNQTLTSQWLDTI